MAIAMILLEWRRQSERIKMYTVAYNKRKSAIQRQWIYKAILVIGVMCVAIV